MERRLAVGACMLAAVLLLGGCNTPQKAPVAYTDPPPAATAAPTPRPTLSAGDEKLRENPKSSAFYPYWTTMPLEEMGFNERIPVTADALPPNAGLSGLQDVLEQAVLTHFIPALQDLSLPAEKCFAGVDILYPLESDTPRVFAAGETIYLAQVAFAAYGFCEGDMTATHDYPPAGDLQETPAPKPRRTSATPEPTPEPAPEPFALRAAFVRHAYRSSHAIIGVRAEDDGRFTVTRFIEPIKYDIAIFSPELASIFPIELLAEAAGRVPGALERRERAMYDAIRGRAEAYVSSIGRSEPVADQAVFAKKQEDMYRDLWVIRPDFDGLGECVAEALAPSSDGIWRVKSAAFSEAHDGDLRVTLTREWTNASETLLCRWVYDYHAATQSFVQVEAQRKDPPKEIFANPRLRA